MREATNSALSDFNSGGIELGKKVFANMGEEGMGKSANAVGVDADSTEAPSSCNSSQSETLTLLAEIMNMVQSSVSNIGTQNLCFHAQHVEVKTKQRVTVDRRFRPVVGVAGILSGEAHSERASL